MKQLNVSLGDDFHDDLSKLAVSRGMSLVDYTRKVLGTQIGETEQVQFWKHDEGKKIKAEAVIYRPKMIDDIFWYGVAKVKTDDVMPYDFNQILIGGKIAQIAVVQTSFSNFSKACCTIKFVGVSELHSMDTEENSEEETSNKIEKDESPTFTLEQIQEYISLKPVQVISYTSKNYIHQTYDYSENPRKIVYRYTAQMTTVTLSNFVQVDMWLDPTMENMLNIALKQPKGYNWEENYESDCAVAEEFAYKFYNIKDQEK